MTVRSLFLLMLTPAALGGCASVQSTMAGPSYYGSRCPPEAPCAPAASPLRQYFDGAQRKYYYYDPTTVRYYWENGSPKS